MNDDIYISPIKFLYEDLQNIFEPDQSNAQAVIGRAISKGCFKGIVINTDEVVAETPKAHLHTGLIEIWETHMAYLWSVCYLMIGLEAIYRKMAFSGKDIVRLSDAQEFEIINHTFAWGRSLKSEFTRWPNGIPNPGGPTEDEHLANRLFIYSMRYMIYHELAHQVLHSDSIDFLISTNSPFYKLSSEDKRRLRTMEIQADDYAFDLHVLNDNEQERYMGSLSAIVAHLSNFYLRFDADTRDTTHTDIDTRLQRLLSKIDISKEPYRTYLDLTFTVGLQVFMTLTDLPYIENAKAYDKYSELQSYLIKIINERKQLYNLHWPVKY
jgi:hypothetical protein